jgi:hypothetical protein
VGVGRFRQLLYRAGVRGQLSWANLLLPLPAGLPVQALIGIVRVVVLLGLGLLVAAVVLKAREPGTYFLRSNTISIVNFSVGAACLLALLSTWAAFVRRLVRCEAQQGRAGWHAGWLEASSDACPPLRPLALPKPGGCPRPAADPPAHCL